ncbi:hypothetical protein GCM10022251_35820 [Phytohabitans flavus]|uniref:PA14 domain-containing protein n=1 Tax=Phytohabitans flavus TaxID=1076124 RepID=A0A6F8XMP5_9ACTN|nr:hypothetical protein [Phytohabitans flavus]BCB75051.1 hypothetical protein Pflav_014610 [Phytohabitans flavus]
MIVDRAPRLVTAALSAFAMLCATVGVVTFSAAPAQAAACIDDNIRLYRAHSTSGSVDTSAGNWIGYDYYQGGTVYVSRNGYYPYVAAFGNHLVANTIVKYTFEGPTSGFLDPQPTVSSNTVMKDTQRYTIANTIPNGRYEVYVEYVNPCGSNPETLKPLLGYLEITD